MTTGHATAMRRLILDAFDAQEHLSMVALKKQLAAGHTEAEVSDFVVWGIFWTSIWKPSPSGGATAAVAEPHCPGIGYMGA
jgi:hypothetical protein